MSTHLARQQEQHRAELDRILAMTAAERIPPTLRSEAAGRLSWVIAKLRDKHQGRAKRRKVRP